MSAVCNKSANFQETADLKVNKSSTTPAATATTGKVHRRRLITGGVSRLLRLGLKLFMLPISIIGCIVSIITGSISFGFWIAGGILRYSLTMIGLTTTGRHREPPPSSSPVAISESAPASEVIDFLSEFELRYGKLHPNFVPVSFTDAVERSRREFKHLFVYLHAPDHPDTPLFCKETLCCEVLSAFVNESFVAWGCSITANGGFEMSRSLNVSRFPFFAVIVAATGQSISVLRHVSTRWRV